MTLDDKIATVQFEMKTSDCECEYYTYVDSDERVNNRVTRRRDEQQLPSGKFMSFCHETACKLIRTRDACFAEATVELERRCDSFP